VREEDKKHLEYIAFLKDKYSRYKDQCAETKKLINTNRVANENMKKKLVEIHEMILENQKSGRHKEILKNIPED